MKKRITSFVLVLVMVCTMLPQISLEAKAHSVVMTANEFISYLQYVVDRDDSKYGSGGQYSVGKYEDGKIHFDCWGLGESIICTRGEIVYNRNPSLNPWNLWDKSSGCDNYTGDALKTHCQLSSDFTNIVPGEWLFRDDSSGHCYHVGYYIGNGKVIESTSDGTYSTQVTTIDSSGHSNIRGSSWTWTSHGKVPWIEYSLEPALVSKEYPAYCAIQPTKDTYVKTMPCSRDSDPNSDDIEIAGKGVGYLAIGLVENKYGNLWYKVQARAGGIGYIFAGDTTYLGYGTNDITAPGVTVPANHKQDSTYILSGSVNTIGNRLTKVSAYVYSGTNTNATPVTGDEVPLNLVDGSYTLGGSPIDNATYFDHLSEGTYTYVVSADYENYYAISAKEVSAPNKGTVELFKATFRVTREEVVNTTPGKPVLYIDTDYTANSPVTFSWAATTNTTHYNLWIRVKNENGEWEKYEWIPYAESGVTRTLPMGEYQFELQSYNSNAWTSDGSDWQHTIGDHVYADIECSHAYGSTITKYPNCVSSGVRTYTCYYCDDSFTEEIPANGEHSWSQWSVVQSPTCTEKGVEAVWCYNCGLEETNTVPALGHDYQNGYCTRCNAVEPKELIAAGSCGDNLSWLLFSDGTLIITGTGTMGDYQVVAAPWDYYRSDIKHVEILEGVTSIGDYAFAACSQLTSVNIGASVNSIGWGAFSDCSQLTSVNIGASVNSIGGCVFSSCSSLTGIWVDGNNTSYSSDDRGVLFNKDKTQLIAAPGGIAGSYTIPDGVTSISNVAFTNCSGLTSITIPDSVTNIGDYAFAWCISLTSITIPDSVTRIGSYVFMGSGSLTSITIPDSVTNIGYEAFRDCNSLTGIWVDDNNAYYCSDMLGVLYNKQKTQLIKAPAENIWRTYIIPDSVLEIKEYAFSNCKNLTSIEIPNSVISIGHSAFSSCTNLADVTIGNSVTNIAFFAFADCYSLVDITIPDSISSIGQDAFYRCEALRDVYYGGAEADGTKINIDDGNDALTSATWHYAKTVVASGDCGVQGNNLTWTLYSDGLLKITGSGDMKDYGSDYAPWDYYRSNINRVEILEGVTGIGDDAFYGCGVLTDITIPGSVTRIGKSAFQACSSLTFVAIGDNVTSIDKGAFQACQNLTTVTIGKGVTSIGDFAFLGCGKLSGIWVDENNATYSSDEFGVLFDKDKTELIAASGNRKSYSVPKGVININDSAFYNCSQLTTVTIPDSVISIGSSAFQSCRKLTDITLSGNVTYIGDYAFYNCINLTNVVYCGTEAQWNATSVGTENTRLTAATRFYHDWVSPTCHTPKYCSVCGEVEVGALGHKYTNGVCGICGANSPRVWVNGQWQYAASITYALKTGSYAQLRGDLAEDVLVTANAVLDLNGFDINGDITITRGATLYLFDSATADYTAQNRGKVKGSITGDLARSFNTPQAYGHNYKYMVIREADGSYSSHRYYLSVKSAVLAPCRERDGYTGTAMDYKTVFKCNSVMAQYVTSYGVRLAGENAVYADYMANGYVLKTGADQTNEQRTRLTDTLKTTNTEQQNMSNAQRLVMAGAFIRLNDGRQSEMVSGNVNFSMLELMKHGDRFADLTLREQAAMDMMFRLFPYLKDTVN